MYCSWWPRQSVTAAVKSVETLTTQLSPCLELLQLHWCQVNTQQQFLLRKHDTRWSLPWPLCSHSDSLHTMCITVIFSSIYCPRLCYVPALSMREMTLISQWVSLIALIPFYVFISIIYSRKKTYKTPWFQNVPCKVSRLVLVQVNIQYLMQFGGKYGLVFPFCFVML